MEILFWRDDSNEPRLVYLREANNFYFFIFFIYSSGLSRPYAVKDYDRHALLNTSVILARTRASTHWHQRDEELV